MTRTLVSFILAAAVLVAATPSRAEVDLLQRLVEKGILTEAERQELERREPPARLASGRGLAYESRDGRFSGALYGYGQVRYTFQDLEDEPDVSTFSVQRVRVGLKGHAFRKDVRYKVYVNVYSGNEKGTDLFDYYVDYVPVRWSGVRVGAYKVPYGVQWTTSASKLQFVERTTVDGNFRFDRDTGVDVHGEVLAGTLAYDLGVFNGEGRNRNNPDGGHLYVGRLSWTPLGGYASHESDNALSTEPRVLVVVGVAYDDDVAEHTRKNLAGRLEALGESDVLSYNGFVGFRYGGASVQAEAHRRRIDPRDDALGSETAVGFYAQGGCFVWRDTLEIAARYEYFDPDDSRGDDLRQEYGVAFNAFVAGHRLKLQSDLFRVNQQVVGGGDTTDDRFRVQLQLAF